MVSARAIKAIRLGTKVRFDTSNGLTIAMPETTSMALEIGDVVRCWKRLIKNFCFAKKRSSDLTQTRSLVATIENR